MNTQKILLEVDLIKERPNSPLTFLVKGDGGYVGKCPWFLNEFNLGKEKATHWYKPVEAVLLSKEDAEKIKEDLELIRSNIRKIIPKNVNIGSELDMALYHSFHASEQALNILNK